MTTEANTVAEQNKALVLKLYDAIGRGDVEFFFSALSPELELHEASSLAYGGVHRGLEAIGGMLGQLADAFDMSGIQVERIVADAEFVVAMASFKTVDHSFRVKISEWWKIQDGKVVEIRPFYWDTQELNGALETPAK